MIMDDSKGDGYHEGNPYNKELTKTQLNWGNFNVALNWNYLFSPKLFANFTAVYSHNRSKLYSLDDDREIYPQTQEERVWSHLEHGYTSTIYDAGYRTAFDYRPNPRHHIRFGHDYTMHLFRPQTVMQLDYVGGGSGVEMDTIRVNSTNRHVSHEWSAYAEDEDLSQ